MARMHARKKGRSSSNHPLERNHPKWGLKPHEIEKQIVKMTEEGQLPAKIGLVLRDSYGVPDIKASLGKKLTKVIEEKNLKPEMPEDFANLLEQRTNLKKHLNEHTRDTHNRRRLQLIDAKINRLARYYKRKGKIPKNWKLS